MIEVLESGRDGPAVYTTRIYATAEDATYIARQWIADNTERSAL